MLKHLRATKVAQVENYDPKSGGGDANGAEIDSEEEFFDCIAQQTDDVEFNML